MCRRYGFDHPERDWLKVLGARLPSLGSRYNLAPTQYGSVVRLGASGGRQAVVARWGLVPRSFPNIRQAGRLAMFNARSETVASSPAFRDAFRRRCLVPASFFYEWRRLSDGSRLPYRVGLNGGRPFAMAGVWERWERDGETLESYAVLTTAPNDLVRPLHDRMPVILERADHEAWLDPSAPPERLATLLSAFPARGMDAWPVSRSVGDVRHDSPDVAEPLALW